jgi:prefoldin subunit 5
MAIYHLSVKTISRGQGRSCVAAAAYRSGENIKDERQGLEHDYSKKLGVESEIIAPANSPAWVNDREKLWNEVDKSETRCNSRTAREINIALPLELSKEHQKELVREYVKDNFVDKGMVADVCFHFNDENNPHCHVMLTTREIDQDGFNKKNRDWDKKEKVEGWREQWAIQANKTLEKAGCDERIDNRSYKDQGIDQIPTIHLGKTSSEMEKKGIDNERAEINKKIKELNKEKVIALQEYRELKAKLEEKKINESQKYSNLKPVEKIAIQKVEKMLNEPQTYENSNNALKELITIRQNNTLKLSKIDFELRTVGRRINNITHNLDSLKMAENEFKELPKNMFGHYKDKNRAETLISNIKKFNIDLTSDGYVSNADIKLNQEKLDDLKKSSEKLKSNINKIDQDSDTIKIGVKALQNKEVREFHKSYKEQFPQAKYLKYSDMKAIQAANKLLGKSVSIEEIKATYRKKGERVDNINKELRGIEANGIRLINAKQALSTIGEHNDMAQKWDTKVFGKAKFQEDHRSEKWQYDTAKANLKIYGVKDDFDLRYQERRHESNVNGVQPKIEVEKIATTPHISVLGYALKGLDKALRTAKAQQCQDDLQLTNAFKGKHHNDEREM